jgi:hypothetical protein
MSPKIAEIAAVLTGTRSALLAAVAGLSQQDLERRPGPDEWSVGEILHHLLLTETSIARLAVRQLERGFAAGLAPDSAPEESVLPRMAHLPVADRSRRLPAPDFTIPTPALARDEVLEQLGRSREALLATLERGDGYDLSGLTYPHPLFGPIDMYQWYLVCGYHEGRHTEQIELAVRKIASGATA